MSPEYVPTTQRSTGLVDILDRVLDKGLVVAGDIRVSLAEVELLTIRIRLIVCSLDKARDIGMDWWQHDQYFSPGKHQLRSENEELKKQVRLLERKVKSLELASGASRPPVSSKRTRPNGKLKHRS